MRLINRTHRCAHSVPTVPGINGALGQVNQRLRALMGLYGDLRARGTGFVIRGSQVRFLLPAPNYRLPSNTLRISSLASDGIDTRLCLLFCVYCARFQGLLPIYRTNSLPGVRHGHGVKQKINPPSHASRSQEGVATPSKPARVGPLATLQSHIDDPAQGPLRHCHVPLPAIQLVGGAA